MSLRERRKKVTGLAVHVVLTIFALLYNLPPISMIGTILKGDTEALSNSDLFPRKVVWNSFRKVLEERFTLTTVNSMKISPIVALLYVILACLTDYSLSRFKGRLFELYGSGVVVLQMFPMMLILIPLSLIYKNPHLIDTHLSLIFSYTYLNLPSSVLLVRGFFDTVPYELEGSAHMDGGSKFDMLVRTVTPISLPGIATAGIFTFLNAWNEYTFANTFVGNLELVILAVGPQDYLPQNSNSWGQMMAASMIDIILPILSLLFARKYLIQGMTTEAMKG